MVAVVAGTYSQARTFAALNDLGKEHQDWVPILSSHTSHGYRLTAVHFAGTYYELDDLYRIKQALLPALAS